VRKSSCRRSLVAGCAGASLLALGCPLRAQTSPPPPPAAQSAQPASSDSADLRTLANSIRELQKQVASLTAQVNELRTDEQRANAEASELRRELASGRPQQQTVPTVAGNAPVDPYAVTAKELPTAPNSVSSASTSPVQSTAGQTLEQRLATLEENQQLADAKLNDQYQTKVESGSKYRLRLSGIVLMNLFDNRGTVDNVDFPEFASTRQPIPSNGSFGGTVRQSEIGLEVFGPDIAGAHTRANLKFDFAGGLPSTPNGVTTGEMRLRTGTLRFDWENTSIIGGQDYLFFSPLDPTSLATLAVPALSYAGNLWSWTPQVRVEHRMRTSDTSNFSVSAGILDSLTGDTATMASNGTDRLPVAGERAGQPAYAARAAWTRKTFGRDLTIGAGGYSARQDWGFGREISSWAGTADLNLPLGKYLDFSGEFYRGRGVGGIGGGIGQSILVRGSGMLTDPSAPIRALDSIGGWAQLKYTPFAKLQFNAAFGHDNPYAREFRGYSWSQNFSYEFLKKNSSWLANFIYQPRSNVLLSLEYRRLQTVGVFAGLNSANHVSLSAGYIF
jgi:hypothetical protein